ncbi:MAG: DinB family protein [Planctomycetota bacterium]
MSRQNLEHAIERMRLARGLTTSFLEDLEPDQWFWQPAEGMNHIAWHVGHLAFAQYFLCMKRVRDRIESDEQLITTKFLKRYKRESKPEPLAPDSHTDPGETVRELRRVFDSVFEKSIAVLAEHDDASLDAPTWPPHPVFDTKLGAVNWCPQHEMMHAGQIVLLRRLQGKAPTW